MGPDVSGLSEGEKAILEDAASDDVSFYWVLDHLNLVPEVHSREWRPGPTELETAFSTLAKLSDMGLIRVGRTEYLDGGPPGRFAPVRHVEEPLSEIRQRVTAALESARATTDWEFKCWIVAAG